jgi:DNA mismatch endonuclease (patch repair protein)
MASAARMKLVRRRDTAAEVAVRKCLWSSGLRYRVDFRPCLESRSRADVAFVRQRVAIYIDGCFWHACPQHATWPKSNSQWWRAKIEADVRRDEDAGRLMSEAGWVVLRFWEHEDPMAVATSIAETVRACGSQASSRFWSGSRSLVGIRARTLSIAST